MVREFADVFAAFPVVGMDPSIRWDDNREIGIR